MPTTRNPGPEGGTMKQLRLSQFAVILFVVAVGTTVIAETNSYFDKQYDFSAVRTWNFKPQRRISQDPLADNRLWREVIENQIATDLQKNGMDRTPVQPDILLAYYLGLKERYQTEYIDYGYPGWWGHRRFGWRWGWPDSVDIWQIPYTDSTLIIDVIDAPSNSLVWRGYDTRTIDMSKPDKTLDKGVDEVLKKFFKDAKREPKNRK
jgi:Domain of unknown function (DUF4136)